MVSCPWNDRTIIRRDVSSAQPRPVRLLCLYCIYESVVSAGSNHVALFREQYSCACCGAKWVSIRLPLAVYGPS